MKKGMKKKIIALALVAALGASAAIGGSLAYFTDTDAKDNTFTVGNVDITIEESMDLDKDGKWEEYTNDQVLTPFDHTKKEVVKNKLVETVNTGSEEAYIRTFVTCPTDMYNYLGLGFNSGANSTVYENEDGTKIYNVTWEDVGTFTIGGEQTSVFLCEVAGKTAVESGDSVLSLTSVWLYPDVTNAMVEEFNLAEGGMFNVKVASQAIQADNLTYEEAMAELGAIDQALMNKLFA